MNILLVEDDYLQEELIRNFLQTRFKDATIETISTEEEFRRRIPEIIRGPDRPHVIILDVMMRWTDPGPDMPEAPLEVKREGPFRAGLRCERILAELYPTIPIILFTILERADLEHDLPVRKHVLYLRKEAELIPLADKIRQLTA